MPDYFELPEEDLYHWGDVYYLNRLCLLVCWLGISLLPAAIGSEVGVEEDPLAGEVVPQSGEVAVWGPGQGWPGWTSFHPGTGTKLEVPTDQ